MTIPAAAFPFAGEYVVGLAGCTRTVPTSLTELNPELTGIRAGLMTYWRILVVD